MDFNEVFTVKFIDERYMWWCELNPPHLINVATRPCESRNSKNVMSQWDIRAYQRKLHQMYRMCFIEIDPWIIKFGVL